MEPRRLCNKCTVLLYCIKVANDLPKLAKKTTCDNLKPGVTYDVYARTMLQSADETPQVIQPELVE